MMTDRFRRIVKFVAKVARLWPEALQAVAIVVGWALVTFGLASLWRWELWPLSFGVLTLSIVGWRYLGEIFWKGLYTLSRKDAGKVDRG